MIRVLTIAALLLCLAGPAAANEPEPAPDGDAPPALSALEAPDDRLPGDFWVGYRPEFGLIGMTGPVLLNRMQVGGGGRMGNLRIWGFFEGGILNSLQTGAAGTASSAPAVVLEGGLHAAWAKPLRRGEWYLGPRFSFGGLDFDLTFASLGAGTGVILGRWDRKAWARLGLDVVAVFPWRLPEYVTLGVAVSASVMVR